MLEKTISFLQKSKELKAAGIISVDIYSMSMHVSIDLAKSLDNLILVDRDSVEYPYFVECEVGGVRIYALATEEEVKEHFPNLMKRG